jgi:hypothetical protein
LRALGLEDWPALGSVLVGHMSLVGPRAVSPRWQTRLHEDVPLYAECMLDVRPGLWGPARAHGVAGDSLLSLAVERVLHDLPYARRLKAAGAGRALALDLGLMWSCLRRAARARRRPGNEVLRIEYPCRFEQLAVDPRELARATPRGMGSEVHEAAGRITAWWYPKRAGAPGLDAGDPLGEGHEFTSEWCDARHALAPHEMVLTKELQPAPGGEDAIHLELPAGLNGIHGLCEHLNAVWEPLQWRSPEPNFALRQNLVLLEGLSRLARGVGSRDDRLAVDVAVGPSGVRSRLQRMSPTVEQAMSVSGLFMATRLV